jgi:hypothetical protein
MHHNFAAALASSREQELRILVNRPERRMARQLKLQRAA